MAAHQIVVGNKGREVQAIIITLTTIAGIFVALRLFTRFVFLRNVGLEDYFVVIAYAFSVACSALIVEQTKYGMGEHVFELSPETVKSSLYPFWASIVVYNLSTVFAKMSVLCQYLRIFPTKKFRIATWIMVVVVIAYGLVSFLDTIFLCFPVRYFWDQSIPRGGKCLDKYLIWYLHAGLNIGTDFIIILMPMPVLKALNMPKRSKIALMGVFALGWFVCVMSILRLTTLTRIAKSADPTFDNPPAATWSSVEINVGVICVSLPSLRPLLSHIFPHLLSTAGSNKDGRYDLGSTMSIPSRPRNRSPAATGRQTSKLKSFTRHSAYNQEDEIEMMRTTATADPSRRAVSCVERGISVVTEIHQTETREPTRFVSSSVHSNASADERPSLIDDNSDKELGLSFSRLK